jgi:hypothetical protein
MLQIAIILSISALAAAQSGNQSNNPPAPPPAATPMIAPPGWVPQNPPAQRNADSKPASVKAAQKKSPAVQPHAQTAKPAHPAAPKN